MSSHLIPCRSQAFFRFIKPVHDAVKDERGLVTFPEFVRLVAAVMENYRWKMDRHIAPQVCREAYSLLL